MSARQAVRRGLTGLLAAICAGSALAQAPESGEAYAGADPPKVGRIEIVGADQLGAGEVRGSMHLRQHSWWRPLSRHYFYGTDHLELDLTRILEHYQGRGFLLARILGADVQHRSRAWVDLRITVEEGPRFHIADARVAEADTSTNGRLESQIRVRRGEPLLESRLQADEARIVEALQNRGHALADVRRELRLRGDSAEVIYAVASGPLVRVGEVAASGQLRTAPDIILREVVLRPGDALRLGRAERSQERLYDLGLFRSVRIRPRFGPPPPPGTSELVADLDIEVTEKPPGWYGFGFGYSSRDRVRLLSEWGYRNLMGRARRLQATGEIAYSLLEAPDERFKKPESWEIELAYAAPWLLGTPTRWQLRSYVRHQRWFEQSARLEEMIYGVALTGRWDLSRYRRLLGSIENKWTAIDSTFVTRFLSLTLVEDRRDFLLDPRSGGLAQVSAEYAGGPLGGETDFTRWSVSLAGYTPMGSGVVWAYRARAGYLHPLHVRRDASAVTHVPIDERFFAGGGTSVRGYDEESLGPVGADQSRGGLAQLVLNGELRLPLFWQLGAVFFLDAGNVWADLDDLGWSRFTRPWTHSDFSDKDVAYGAGAGVRFSTPVGPVRLDYGYKVGSGYRAISSRDSAWHFSLGQAF